MNINLTLFGQLLSFAAFVWFCMKYVWPPLIQVLEVRKAKIADGLAAAERGRHELELAEKRATEKLHEAKRHAAEIIAQAERRGAEIVEEAKEQAKAEGDRQLAAAQAEIDQEVNKAREALRAKVADLAIVGASRILSREIDAKAHTDLLDELVGRI